MSQSPIPDWKFMCQSPLSHQQLLLPHNHNIHTPLLLLNCHWMNSQCYLRGWLDPEISGNQVLSETTVIILVVSLHHFMLCKFPRALCLAIAEKNMPDYTSFRFDPEKH